MSDKKSHAEALLEQSILVDDLREKVTSLTETITQLTSAVAVITSRAEQSEESLKEIREDIKSLVQLSQRWRGGIVVLAALGGIVGWVISTWGQVGTLFHK